MKKLISQLTAILLLLASFSCSPNVPSAPSIPNIGSITLSQEPTQVQIDVARQGGHYSVDIFSNDEISIECTDEWINTTKRLLGTENDSYHYTLYFKVLANDTKSLRKGKISISCQEYSATLIITQDTQYYPSEITVSVEPSRTYLGDIVDSFYPIYWLPQDKIICNGNVSEQNNIDDDFTSVATFKFSNPIMPPYSIVYPAPSNGVVATKAGCYPVVFPEQQNYVEGSFENGAAPMYGYTTETHAILQPLTGTIRLAIKGEERLSHILISTETGYISGTFDLNCQTGELTPQEGKVSNQMVYSFGDGLQLHPDYAEFLFFTIPAGSYESISLTIYSIAGEYKTFTMSRSTSTIKAGTVKAMTVTVEFTGQVELELGLGDGSR